MGADGLRPNAPALFTVPTIIMIRMERNPPFECEIYLTLYHRFLGPVNPLYTFYLNFRLCSPKPQGKGSSQPQKLLLSQLDMQTPPLGISSNQSRANGPDCYYSSVAGITGL